MTSGLTSATSTATGGLVAWGDNTYGKTDVPASRDFTGVVAGEAHSLALRADGSLAAWGDNRFGQTDVPAGDDFTAVAAGGDHSLALRGDGSLVAWGDNRNGQSNVPAGNDFTAAAAGYNDSVALRADGTLVAWGNNFFGQTDVPPGNDFVTVARGYFHGVALRDDGSLVAWGQDWSGQTDVPAGNDFVAVAAAYYHSVALRSDGSLVAWGNNTYGQTDVPAGNDFVAVAAGYYHGVALRSDGSLVAWGNNAYGKTDVPAGNEFTAIAAGAKHNVAITTGNRAPVLAGVGSRSVIEGNRLDITVAASDLDGDPLTYNAANVPTWATFDPHTHVLTGTPDPDDIGSHTVTFTVSDGADSDSENVTLAVRARPPSSPLNVQAVGGNGTAEITWSAPTDPGSGPLTGYRVRTGQGTTVAVVGADTTSVTASNLSNGRTYTFTVAAANSYETGPPGTSEAVTPMGPPGRAGSVTAIRGDRGATVTWAPAGDNGSAVTGYTVAGSNGQSKTVNGDRTRVSFDRLTNGRSYTFTVVATNAVGTGPSARSNTVVPAGLPGSPGGVRAVAGNRSATISWRAATGNGAPVSSYRINPGRGPILSVSGARTSATVRQLRNGVQYTFRVRAVNAVGVGPVVKSNPVRPHR